MRKELIDLKDSKYFSSLFLDYLSQDNKVRELYRLFPSRENFEKQIANKSFSMKKRETLKNALIRQHEGFHLSPITEENILALAEENTFTVTTGHQLNIFTGPLYFIFKIITIINLAKELREKYPQYNFVPVYWMHTEDHDFAEISFFNLFSKKYQWETDQKGAAGRFRTEGMEKVLQQVADLPAFFEEAYMGQRTLGAAHRYLVNEIFGKDGLVILDGDDAELKSEFSDVIKDDILKHTASGIVVKTNNKIEELGYKVQVNPREINFFYLDGDIRERIVEEAEGYKVLNTSLFFSKEQLFQLIDLNPEKFSANVVTRPLYQEYILPNLAYIGGPGELSYWLQYKELFSHYNIPFPILMPRNFAMVINKNLDKKIQKLGLSCKDLFEGENELKKKFIAEQEDAVFDFAEEQRMFDELFDKLKEKLSAADKTLEGFVLAEKQKALKIIEGIEKRAKRSSEDKLKVEIDQLLNIKSRLFPNGSLQEREDNFLNFYINDPAFIDKLKACLDPFDFRFHILREDE
ncbi:MAG TPA: bacillithiol biosynthesis cysteine-adding enzyme BshC [Cytophagaceae bacterium]|jgi:bacillithiol biosynthesis cysteine-adding enzyme BshC|nr:bacillithiol biosynthesis cysteine-adding enzyme BshC [Cytophagaceae bacterium]